MTALSVAISPCPNDTFIFAAWILGAVSAPHGMDSRFLWHDVQELNHGAFSGRWDITKVSAATALRLTNSHILLPTGGAFGLEHGPKLVTRNNFTGTPRTIAVPGMDTTAMCLLSAALQGNFTPVPMIFHAIVDAVLEKKVDAGLLIHETALVYERHGLTLHTDLGAWWKAYAKGLPLPLGCIVADKSLPQRHIEGVVSCIRDSIRCARTHPEVVFPLVESLARELDEPTLQKHITAYVNDFSLNMGSSGEEALRRLQSLQDHL